MTAAQRATKGAPEVPRAYDRIKNANNVNDNFIRTPYWTNEVEADFESWVRKNHKADFTTIVTEFLGSGVAVSFKELDGSICCTLAHQANREALLPYLLTGWSDNPEDALAVAHYKLGVMLGGIWEA